MNRALNKLIKVLMVIPGKKNGSSMIFAKRQTVAINEFGLNAKVFYLASRVNPFTLIKEWRRFREEIKNYQPDVIHAQFGTMTSFFCAFGSLKPLVVTFRGSDINPVPSANILRDIFGKFFSQVSILRAKRIICVSEEIRRRLWWGKSKAIVLPTGVDTKTFFPIPQSEARKILGIRHNKKIIIFNAGKEPKVKRFDLAKAAFDKVREKMNDTEFVVLRGDLEPYKVVFYLNAADCLLLTSDFEGSPTIIQEAMACNLPIVSVDVGDVRERLKNVQPSIITERDPADISKGLTGVLKNEKRSNGFETAKDISQENIAKKIVTLYGEIL